MKTYVSDGNTLTVAAPAALTSGAGALVGSIFGIAMSDAANGADVVLQVTGVVEMTKQASQAWTVGAAIYWNNTTKVATTASSGNTKIGVATVAVGSGGDETTGTVRLSAAF